MRLRAGQHLRRNADFGAVREQGRRTDCGAFLLTWRTRPVVSAGQSAPASTTLAGTASRSRVGVVASRAAVGDAVHRNRAKRRLREIYRRHQTLVPPGLDVVLTARAALLRLEFAEVEQRFIHACQKLMPVSPTPHA